MAFPRDTRRLLAALVAAATLACSSDEGSPGEAGEERPEQRIASIRLQNNAPALVSDSVSFWAVKGVPAEGSLFFQNPSGGPGQEYMQLRIGAASLESRPDGTPIATGDSVLIRIKVVDPAQILFELEPTGLTFSPANPAELRIRYDKARRDLNEDGDEDAEDVALEGQLSIWRQEAPGLPFVRLGTVRFPDQKQLRAVLYGFSRYAIAY